MAYTTTADLEAAAGGADRLVQCADWDGDGEVDATVLASAQAAADGLINSHAAKRYAVPIEEPSDVVVQHAAAEVIYLLRARRGMLTEHDVELKKTRDVWLEALGKGQVRPSDPLPAKSSAVRTSHRSSSRDVAREKLKGYW